jgi:hypothetical protein
VCRRRAPQKSRIRTEHRARRQHQRAALAKSPIKRATSSGDSSIDRCPVPGTTCRTACGMRAISSFLSVSTVSIFVEFAGNDRSRYVDGPNLRGNVFEAGGSRPGNLRWPRAAQAVPDHLFAVLGGQWVRCQHIVDGQLHRFARGTGSRHHLPCFCRHAHRRRRSSSC